MFTQVLLLIFGVFCCSTAIIWIRLSHTNPILLAGLRCLVASLVLTPLMIRDLRNCSEKPPFRRIIMPGILLAIHFATWILGARMVPVVNASLIVNMVPLVMPFILLMMLREKPTLLEFIGTVTSIAGLLLMTAKDASLDPQFLLGDITCFASMLFFAVYLAIARQNTKTFPSLWIYITPVYLIAGCLSTAAGLFLGEHNGRIILWKEMTLVLCLGIIPTVLGHSMLNLAMRKLRGQVVALANMTQFIFAGLLAYLIPQIGETPIKNTYFAAILIVSGMLISIQSRSKKHK